MTRRATLALVALAAIFVITAGWWALALWPVAAETPAWLERTRAVCFGVAHGGLPDAAGWIVLIGEPVGMLLFLLFVWGDAVREGLRAARRSFSGSFVLGTAAASVLVGGVAVVTRVASALEAAAPPAEGAEWSLRHDRAPPPLALVDQHGDTVRLEQFVGRPVMLVFAYGHCATVCPLIVQDAVRAVERARARDVALLVVTLDPWRDTPARLPHLAEAWRLPPGARVLSGSVPLVERTLDAWQVARVRDGATGEIAHPTSVTLVDRRGRLARTAGGGAGYLAAVLDEL